MAASILELSLIMSCGFKLSIYSTTKFWFALKGQARDEIIIGEPEVF